jgi:hypothetical protein
MFKRNDDHYQIDMLETANWMNKKTIEKLNKSWAVIFYEEVFCKIDENIFAELYSTENGRSNVPVNILLGLEYIKSMFDYTDEELLEQFCFNLLVSYALGIRKIGTFNFARSSFYKFRKKLYMFKEKHPETVDIINKQFNIFFKNFVNKAKIDTSFQRTDSTSVIPNIAKAGRVALGYDVLRNALSIISVEILPESLKIATTSDFKKEVLYRVKASEKDSKFEIIINLCAELLSLVKERNDIDLNSPKIKVLERFLNEQSKIENDKYITKKPAEISSGSLQSAYDEDATFRNKAGKKESGYVLNIAETCSKDNEIQLISDYELEQNNKSDVEIINKRLPEIKKTGCKDMYADGAFYSKDNGKEENINFHYTDMTGKPADPSKISILEFGINKEKNVITTCPGGFNPIDTEFKTNNKKEQIYIAIFDRKNCENCPHREYCQVKVNKKFSVVRINEKSYKAAETRIEIELNKAENSSYRVAIEGTNSELKRKHGMKKLKVRGKVKSSIVCGLIVTACNIKRFIKYAKNNLKKMNGYQIATG